MLPAARLVLIDDNLDHLRGLADSLNGLGTASYCVHFSGDAGNIVVCDQARIVFADLHLNESGTVGDQQHFSTIGGLLKDSLKPAGPYVLVLWTSHADKAANLEAFLRQRLGPEMQPICVKSLDKSVHLKSDGKVRDVRALMTAIQQLFADQKEVAALLDWETRALGAAAETVSSLLQMAEPGKGGQLGERVRPLLYRLAAASVGKGNVAADRFKAVNEALLPILADRISNMKTGSATLWDSAVDLSEAEKAFASADAAKLNKICHLSEIDRAGGHTRGAVIALPDDLTGEGFKSAFGLEQEEVAKQEFGAKEFKGDDSKLVWSLVQTQAPCDHAQRKMGPLPFSLLLEMPAANLADKKIRPNALWTSPNFWLDGEEKILCVNHRYPVALTAERATKAAARFRFREQLLAELSHAGHAYLGRPGIIRFEEAKAKAKPKT